MLTPADWQVLATVAAKDMAAGRFAKGKSEKVHRQLLCEDFEVRSALNNSNKTNLSD